MMTDALAIRSARTDEEVKKVAEFLHCLRGAAEANEAEVVVFHCPHDGTLGEYLRRHGAAEYAPGAERETDLHVRVLDLLSCLRMMEPQLSRRVQQSEFCNANLSFNLVTDDVSVGLRLHNGRTTVGGVIAQGQDIRAPGERMAQLPAGFSSAVQSNPRLLQVLFPPGEPYWYVDDI